MNKGPGAKISDIVWHRTVLQYHGNGKQQISYPNIRCRSNDDLTATLYDCAFISIKFRWIFLIEIRKIYWCEKKTLKVSSARCHHFQPSYVKTLQQLENDHFAEDIFRCIRYLPKSIQISLKWGPIRNKRAFGSDNGLVLSYRREAIDLNQRWTNLLTHIYPSLGLREKLCGVCLFHKCEIIVWWYFQTPSCKWSYVWQITWKYFGKNKRFSFVLFLWLILHK